MDYSNYKKHIRQIDSLGRIVIPMDLRIKFDLQNYSFVEIFEKGEFIIMQKTSPESNSEEV